MKTYLVGGAVRDRLLGRDARERDWVVVGASEDEMLANGYRRVGHAFPVFINPETGEEYALARTESKVAPGHTGFEFDTSRGVDLATDLKRRDLTINAMAEADGEIIDPYEGRRDLEHRVLRHVSEAFVEDPLRVLRVARFCAELRDFGFVVAEETLELMEQIAKSGELDDLPRERVWGELAKVLDTRWLDVFLTVLDHANCLNPWFQECDWPDADRSRLGTWQRHLPSPVARLAALGGILEVDDCRRLLTRLGPPKRHMNAALLVARHAKVIQSMQREDLGDLHAAFLAFSRVKPIEAREELLRVIAEVSEVGFAELTKRVTEFDTLRPAKSDTTGTSGKDYGQRLMEARLALLTTWLDS